jgi:fumarate reductase subunit C
MRPLAPVLFLAQRATAVMLLFVACIHLATIMVAVRGGLTAGEVLVRTHGNGFFLAVYSIFVFAASVHAPIGLRNVLREWTPWRGRSLDYAMLALGIALFVLGFRATRAVFLA